MSMLSNLNIEKNRIPNFWKLYPQYKIPKEYKKLFNVDKTKDKSKSSNKKQYKKYTWYFHRKTPRTKFKINIFV